MFFLKSRGSKCFSVELYDAMATIEIAYKKGRLNLWLECDSQLVVSAFCNKFLIPWKIINKCHNCLLLTKRDAIPCFIFFMKGIIEPINLLLSAFQLLV